MFLQRQEFKIIALVDYSLRNIIAVLPRNKLYLISPSFLSYIIYIVCTC